LAFVGFWTQERSNAMHHVLLGFVVGALLGFIISSLLHYGSEAPHRCGGALVCGDTYFLALAFGICGMFVVAFLF